MLPVLVVPSPLPRRHFGAAAGGVHPIINGLLPIRLAQLALDVVSGPSGVRAAARSGFLHASEAQDRFASEEGRRRCLVACQLSARPTSPAGGPWSRRSGPRSARPRDITTHPQDVVRG